LITQNHAVIPWQIIYAVKEASLKTPPPQTKGIQNNSFLNITCTDLKFWVYALLKITCAYNEKCNKNLDIIY
jgi:hypothetical protein